jgi:hypothetical protein
MSAPPPDDRAPEPATVNGDVTPSRTSAATAARRRARSERLCREVVERLPELDGPMLAALYVCVGDEVTDRIHARAEQGAPEPPVDTGR